MDSKIFISFSHKDRSYRDELVPALEAVAAIRDRVWFDQKGIDVGDRFHPEIQRALAESKVGILLVSNHFLTSDYITRHELPFLLRQAERGALKLGILHVSAVAKAALSVTVEIDGKPRTVNLVDTIGVNSPAEPLDKMSRGDRNALYARAADWAVRQLAPAPAPTREPTGARHDLAIFVQARHGYWEHQFFLPNLPRAIKPKLDCPEPALVLGYDLDGETLFQLLFGSDQTTVGDLLAPAFDAAPPADPTYAPLRVRLVTDDSRLQVLPWGSIAYRGRPLAQAGWTVEFHAKGDPGFPEYPQHRCYFPGRVVLIGSTESHQSAHFRDLQRFFQRHWPENPDPTLAADADALRVVLQAGSTRLVYYYGPASREGLLLQDRADGGCVPWPDFAKWLKQSQSVSLLFLNLVGETGYEALAQGPILVDGVKGAVLLQCNPSANAHVAAKAGLAWLDAVFCRQLDPVVALHQQAGGPIAAWTRYSSWQTVAPPRPPNPDLVNLLLDRHTQRNALSGARDDFYTYATRHIVHVVALGTPGCLTRDFPEMIKQHLVRNQREREVYYFRSIDLTANTDNTQRIDDWVRRRFHLTPHQPLLEGLLDPATVTGTTFCFLVLGWQAGKTPVNEAALRAVADWCRSRLGKELGASDWQGKVRVISILALESERTDELADTVERLIEEYDTEPGFHFGELEPLAAVRRQDLRNYFRNEMICGCDDRYRESFPDVLLAKRKEMPFDEAVATIRRGEPDNWGNLFDELTDMTNANPPAWPPPHYDPTFWSTRDGR
ncbi:MAG TPA: toll/interleukin-1 receptor domain-containing protein [Candidatus Competibacter sp.]|nr:toll/interleukin-1 receptor domain-containing protein [Candidatus Competibacteraceae bacterium]HPE71875.1 toll/interleukin-1 receptor domain-containing protein [Candidatus Competibacter sp.]HRW65876.1 toll/interleukin-1 receptor domain-containing protein [Candidatus Competibacter sp.]